jgi:myo-inositol-1(or 4)-monophosphatase
MTEAQRESLCALIRQAGAHAQALRDAGLQVDKKARQDFVSQADLAVEQEIKGWLQAHFPEEGFLGEESGFEGDDQTVWVLDPVDGTTNFILGMDYWCISLARVCQASCRSASSTPPIAMNFSSPAAAKARISTVGA